MVMNKDKRHRAITEIVREKTLSTQHELLDVLTRQGLAVNQATLSRDLAEVGIRKSQGRYVLAEEVTQRRSEYAAVTGFTCCGPHMIVIRTAVGQAQAVAVMIDQEDEPAFAGTIAGDDTILVLTKNRRTQTVALRRLRQWFGEKHER